MVDVKGSEEGGTALLLVDLQYDFLPGGSLAVEGGDQILEPIAELLERVHFDVVVATQDWHPARHASFASSHPGHSVMETIEVHGHPQRLWPDHCVAGTHGAELHEGIPWERVSAVIRKGSDPGSDSYSGFRNNWNAAGERPATGLAGYLRERGVGRVYLCGLARDYCVKWSAEDAVAAGFDAVFLWELTRAVDPSADVAVRRDLEAAGVGIVDSMGPG